MRKTWDQYFMEMALMASQRGTCNRLHVGCVLVRDRGVLSTGYNGSIRGEPHCDEDGHDLDDGHCVRTVHAEMNAICMAAKNGHFMANSTAYVTHFPCWLCYKLLVQSGVERIVYSVDYKNSERVVESSKRLGIEIKQEKI